MAAKTAAQLITTVRTRSGRSNDSVLITAEFVLDALNEAQIQIVRRSPGMIDLETIDEAAYQLSTDQTTLDLSTIDPAHISKIQLLILDIDGKDDGTRRQGIEYMRKDRFFCKYVIPASETASEPVHYTRVGNTLYFNCPVSEEFNGNDLRFDYTKFATAFPTIISTNTSDIKDADKGLILFALAECYDEMALTNNRLEAKALKTRGMFDAWLFKFMEYNEMSLEEQSNEIPI
jgi:hypothetical protein